MKKLIWLPLAGFLLIAGAAVAAAAPGVVGRVQSALPLAVETDDQATESDEPVLKFRGEGFLTEVLDELVAAGTITQDQADAITNALQAKAEAKRAELEQMRQLWQSFVEDGVITQDEIDQLPADSPLREAWNSIAEDGQVTLDQLRELGPFGGHHRGPGGFGFKFHGDWPAPPDSEEVPTETPTPGS